MRQVVIIAIAISLAAISAHAWNALAQEGVPRPVESLSAKPSVPATRYQMFFDDGTPTRPSTSIKIKEAGDLKMKEEKSSGKGKIDQSKIQPPNLLASPKVDPSLAPSAATDRDQYKVKVRFPTLTPGSESGWARVKANDQRTKQSNDDTALNAAACKAAAAAGKPLPSFCRSSVQIDRTFLDRLEAERVEQFRSGPGGGFNPNKP